MAFQRVGTIGVISSLVTKTSGQVKILDIDIDENHSLAKKKLGVVGQEVNFNQFEKVKHIRNSFNDS